MVVRAVRRESIGFLFTENRGEFVVFGGDYVVNALGRLGIGTVLDPVASRLGGEELSSCRIEAYDLVRGQSALGHSGGSTDQFFKGHGKQLVSLSRS